MDRYWLLTWTTYGTWLPGDSRGSVTTLLGPDGNRETYNCIGTDPAPPRADLRRFAAGKRSAEPAYLTSGQAGCVLQQFHETAAFRQWRLVAAAVLSNHCHLVVGVPGDPAPEKVLGDFKAYGTRRLNREFGQRRWWTESGSTRKLADEGAVIAARGYVRNQTRPLATFVMQWDELPEGGTPSSPVD